MDFTTAAIVIGIIVAFAGFLVWAFTYHGPWLIRVLKTWLFTSDHRRIGLMYIGIGILFFFIGGIYATIIRTDLGIVQGLGLDPQTTLGITPDVYSTLFSMHGVLMIFMFRSQRRRQRATQETQRQVANGSKVRTVTAVRMASTS